MIRTFIALELPERLRNELAKIVKRFERSTPTGVNWVQPDNMHLTLLFIGDVPEHRIQEIDALVGNQLEGFPAFQMQAEGLELFPSIQPRLLWLKLSSANEDIFKLNRKLIKVLSILGIESDRKQLKLHVTLARLKTGIKEPVARELMQIPLTAGMEAYNSISLFKSVLTPSGPIYTTINKYNLK